MINTMSYQGYTASMVFDAEDKVIVGRVLDIDDIISFHGESVSEFETRFHAAIDDYIAACAELGSKPDKPASGRLMLRIAPEVHAAPLAPSDHIASFADSVLARWAGLAPWQLTLRSTEIVRVLLEGIDLDEFAVAGDVAIHRTAIVEAGAVLKGPLILGANCFVAAGAYLRGGNWVDANCTFGPGAELKSSFVFAGTKLAHFNFVGDSVLGAHVNLEAGAIICNYRNERSSKEILVRDASGLDRTGVDKFGALVGDASRIGANAVIAPGALLPAGSVVGRASLCDQEVELPGGDEGA